MTRTNDRVRNVVIPHLDGKNLTDCPLLPSNRVWYYGVWYGDYYASGSNLKTVNLILGDKNPFEALDNAAIENGNYDDEGSEESAIEEQLTVYELDDLLAEFADEG